MPFGFLKNSRGEEEHLHIYGGVNADGTQMEGVGEGFTSEKTGTGTYKITFTPSSFASKPAPVCTVDGQGTFDKSISIIEITKEYFTCITSNATAPVDCAFTFIAFGDA
ncbi:MAG: hypothetical protein F6K54_04855 [Okeania sp. SIO3B5]|uniref:hypothetical protein n=1 Tax=Okeania sp. SIO3B5 TaxID=2607811 RepID=UPI001400E1B7|nr:hypothetical protein [Okeania sp. SIO3B5]NEO52460.1 hypothetical protein [Okeania sp. SIO3B5]